MRAIFLKNDLTVQVVNNVPDGKYMAFSGGDYVLSPICVNRVIDLDDKKGKFESELIYFQNGSSPIPRDVDFSDKDKLKQKTQDYLNEAVLENYLDNVGFWDQDHGIVKSISGLVAWFNIPRLVVLFILGSVAYSLITGAFA